MEDLDFEVVDTDHVDSFLEVAYCTVVLLQVRVEDEVEGVEAYPFVI